MRTVLSSWFSATVTLLMMVWFVSLTYAQLPPITDDDWEPMVVHPPAKGVVHATALDESGHYYIGGRFKTVGTTAVSNVAAWRDGQWEPVGTKAGPVSKLFFTDGGLHAIGDFSDTGGPEWDTVARWDGGQWQPADLKMGEVLQYLHTGDRHYVVGQALTGNEEAGPRIARWGDGEWQRLGGGLGADFGEVENLVSLDEGLFVTGETRNGPTWSGHIARWDGQQWVRAELPVNLGGMIALFSVGDGNVYANGLKLLPLINWGIGTMAMWDGESWSLMGKNGQTGWVSWVLDWATINGDLYVVGPNTRRPEDENDRECCNVAKWDGEQWTPLGTEIHSVGRNLEVINGELYAREPEYGGRDLYKWEGESRSMER